jgi:lysine biosynthesis protein LysW
MKHSSKIYHSVEGKRERFKLLDGKEELIECGTVIYLEEKSMKTGKCPECGIIVEIQNEPTGNIRGMRVHDIVDCDECGAELKIMALDPLVAFSSIRGNYEIEINGLEEYNQDVSSDFYEGGRN